MLSEKFKKQIAAAELINAYPCGVEREAAEELAEVDSERGLEVLQAIAEASGGSIGEVLETYNKGCYQFYQGMDLKDVAEKFVNDCYKLPEFALRYFDFEAFGRDLGFDGYTETSKGVIYIE